MNTNPPPIHVWRAFLKPGIGNLRGKCQYCGGRLGSGSSLHEVTRRYLAEREPEAERDFFGKELIFMTQDDWGALFKKNKRSNDACPDTNWPMPTDEESCLDIYDFTRGIPSTATCPICGWWCDSISYNHGIHTDRTAAAALKAFSLESHSITIAEIVSHLARNYTDVYCLSPTRFEQIIAHVYKSIGWTVTLTKQSRDGGIDLYCISNGDDTCIVECKRYAESRAVGVAMVDRLLGVAYRNEVTTAHLVTTSRFSKPAMDAASEANKVGEITLDLIDAHEVSRLFRLYADSDLTVKDLKAIISHAGTIPTDGESGLVWAKDHGVARIGVRD